MVPLVLVVLALAADRTVVRVAEDRVARRLRESMHLDEKPDVSIRGFPFLNQVVTGHYGEIRIAATDLPQGTVPLSRIELILYGVRPQAHSKAHVEGVGGRALISFADLARAVGRRRLTFAAAGENLLTIAATVDSLGFPLETRATSEVTLKDGHRLQVRVVTIEGLPSHTNRAAAESLDFTVPLTNLPVGIELTGLRVVPDGIELQVSGKHTLLAAPAG
jgi:LmeA-like phospholipid-binding